MAEQNRMVTGLFRDRESAERAYQALEGRGYQRDDLNVLMTDETRKKYFADGSAAKTELGTKALEGAGVGAGVGAVTGGVIAAVAATDPGAVLVHRRLADGERSAQRASSPQIVSRYFIVEPPVVVMRSVFAAYTGTTNGRRPDRQVVSERNVAVLSRRPLFALGQRGR